MRRRLTIAIVGTVAAALLLAGFGTLVFARIGARNATEADLRAQAEVTADLMSVGTNRLDAVTTADVEAIRATVCGDVGPTGPTSTTPTIPTGTTVPPGPGGAGGPGGSPGPRGSVPSAANEQLRALFCASGDDTSVASVQARVCQRMLPRIATALPDELRSARDAFCSHPDEATLSDLQLAFCTETGDARTSAARIAVERYRLLACTQVRRAEQRTQLESTLSKESIDLVVVGLDDGEVRSGTLPPGLSVERIQPDRLRVGETVSGLNGRQLFAAAPVTGGTEVVSVIVIQRDADPIRDSVQWFLLAAAVTLVLGALVAAFLSRRLTDPLREVTALTVAIAEGDLTARLPEHTVAPTGRPRDEIDELAHSINAMAGALERSKGLERQFLLSVSHDLRTPLTSIRGYAEAIADGAAPDPQRAAATILAESRRLERLVRDLLDLARLDARRFTLSVVELDLRELAEDSVDGFRREVEGHGLTLRGPGPLEGARPVDGGTPPAPGSDPAPDPGPARAYADPDRLQQVIANLVENAVKFARTTIWVAVTGSTIEVGNDGPGIAQADLPHVFERLYVASAAPVRKETGSGLGLAIVHELVVAMGGTVTVTSPPDGWTTFRVQLPTTPPSSPSPPLADPP